MLVKRALVEVWWRYALSQGFYLIIIKGQKAEEEEKRRTKLYWFHM